MIVRRECLVSQNDAAAASLLVIVRDVDVDRNVEIEIECCYLEETNKTKRCALD